MNSDCENKGKCLEPKLRKKWVRPLLNPPIQCIVCVIPLYLLGLGLICAISIFVGLIYFSLTTLGYIRNIFFRFGARTCHIYKKINRVLYVGQQVLARVFFKRHFYTIKFWIQIIDRMLNYRK